MSFSRCIIRLVFFNSCVTELVLVAVELLADEFYEPTIISFTLFFLPVDILVITLSVLNWLWYLRLRTRQRRSEAVATLF